MEILRNIIIGIHVIICFALIIVTMMQGKNDSGMSGAMTGSASDNYLDKNGARTRKGKLKRWTVILGISFVIATIALSITYVI